MSVTSTGSFKLTPRIRLPPFSSAWAAPAAVMVWRGIACFLATSANALLRACAIVQLWRDGFVEPIGPPANPLHVLVQQLMALALQLNGLGIRDWRQWLGRLPPFAHLSDDEFQRILDHLLQRQLLYSDGIRLSLGDKAHEEFGRRHFMELLSVFTTPPLMTGTG